MVWVLVCTTLVVALLPQPSLAPMPDKWTNFLPWSKDMPETEYKKHINVILVDKRWKPDLREMPDTDELLPFYPGSVNSAFAAFKNKANDYRGHERKLEKGFELLVQDYGFNSTLESIFIIHTLSGNAKNWMVRNIVIAMAMRNMVKNYNVFTFDMPGLEGSIEKTVVKSFFGLKTNYHGLSIAIGQFLEIAIDNGLLEPSRIHLVGFCWSGQLAGYIARHIKLTTKKKIQSVLAMDPHSFGISRFFNTVLKPEDAVVVHAYHTNSILFGTLRQEATADFVFNLGLWQPGCYFTFNVMCSHRRAVLYLWYLIIYPNLFVARSCNSWFAFESCKCQQDETSHITFPPETGARGNYYINTMAHKPFGYGAEGANCVWKRKNKPSHIAYVKDIVVENVKDKGRKMSAAIKAAKAKKQ